MTTRLRFTAQFRLSRQREAKFEKVRFYISGKAISEIAEIDNRENQPSRNSLPPTAGPKLESYNKIVT